MTDYERLIREARSLREFRHLNGDTDAADSFGALTDAVVELRETLELREAVLLRAGRDNLRLGNELGRVYAAANVEITDEWTASDALDLIRRVLDEDGAPDPRRIETAAELDALPTGAAVLMHSNLDGSDTVGIVTHFRDREYDQIHFGRNAESLSDAGRWLDGDVSMTLLWLPEVDQ